MCNPHYVACAPVSYTHLSEKLGLDVVGFLSGLGRPTLVLTAVIAVLGVPAASVLLSVAIYKKKEF